jgi:CDGSH-type Zn-finger protein
MAREVIREEREPAILDESDMGDDGLIYVCQCGLSDSKPLCDGSHRATADEEESVIYKYANDDADGERREVARRGPDGDGRNEND